MLPAYIDARAKQLGLKRHILIGLLLSNFLNGPKFELQQITTPNGKIKRFRIQLSLPRTLRQEGQRIANQQQISFSRLLECLLFHDAFHGAANLAIFSVPNHRKPEFDISKVNLSAPSKGIVKLEGDIRLITRQNRTKDRSEHSSEYAGKKRSPIYGEQFISDNPIDFCNQ